MDAALTIVIIYCKTALMWINWEGEPSGHAENLDN
jgi:hypothetical protein